MKEKSLDRAPRSVVPVLLPVRTHHTWWQRLKSWFQQGWQRLWQPHVRIQPPLQPARHKPFPQRPHQHRRQAVFAALDAAPAGLTRRQLIAHVRTVTGVGCSEKLITQWRATRKSASAKEGKGDARTHIVQLRLFLLCLVLGAMTKPWHSSAVGAAQEITIAPAPSTTPTISHLPSPIPNHPVPRLLRIKLTINAASDLLVQTDDEVKAGQALTNRSHERHRLFAQRRILTTQAQQIAAQLSTAAASLTLLAQRGADLPPLSFASEQAAITKAAAAAVVTARQVELQRQKLAVVGGRWSVVGGEKAYVGRRNAEHETRNSPLTDHQPPTTDHWQLITEHETAKLTQAQDAERQAHAEIALQKAKLKSAQEARAFAEKQHALEVAKQWLTARQQQQQAVLARSQLLTQIAALDLQLAHLAAVRAPFAGKIKRIEYEDMHDQTITVLLYLSVHQ